MEEIYLCNHIYHTDFAKNRKINIHKFFSKWNTENCAIFNCAKDFVEIFGDLKIKIKQCSKPIFYTIIITPEYCQMSNSKINMYNKFLAKDVLCVGFISGCNYDLLLSDDGKFYVAIDEDISCWGNSFEELLENIFTDKIAKCEWYEIEE